MSPISRSTNPLPRRVLQPLIAVAAALAFCTALPAQQETAAVIVQHPAPAAGQSRADNTIPAPRTITYTPPLSLHECILVLELVEKYVPRSPDVPREQVPVKALLEIISTTSRYMTFRDDLHSSLSDYTWVELDDEYVNDQPHQPDTDLIELDLPVEKISAVGLEAERNDLLVHEIVIYDEEGQMRERFDFTQEPVLLQHTLPRREVFHLWRRTKISRVKVTTSRPDDKRTGPTPRVLVYGGSTDRKEDIKTALYYLNAASKDIRDGDWTDAHDHLSKARKRIRDFIDENKPD